VSTSGSLDILDAMHAHAVHRPHEVAVIDEHGRYTTSELWDASCSFAGWLRSSGAGPGATVAIAMGGTAPHFGAVFGALLAGATVAPLTTPLTKGELERYVEVIAPALVLVDPGTPDASAGLPGAVVVDGDQTALSLHARLGVTAGDTPLATLGPDVAEDT